MEGWCGLQKLFKLFQKLEKHSKPIFLLLPDFFNFFEIFLSGIAAEGKTEIELTSNDKYPNDNVETATDKLGTSFLWLLRDMLKMSLQY